MLSSLEPRVTIPVTSNVLLSEDARLTAHPLAWLSPIIEILFLFLRGLKRQLYAVFTGVAFPTFLLLPLVALTPLTITGIVPSISADTIYLFIYFIMCSVDPYKVDIELVKVNITYSYKWEIKLSSKRYKLQNRKYEYKLRNTITSKN